MKEVAREQRLHVRDPGYRGELRLAVARVARAS